MRKLVILTFIFSVSLSAADWESQGFTIVSSQKDENSTTLDIVKDKNNNELGVTYVNGLSEGHIRIIAKYNDEFRSWASMKVSSIKFSVIGEEIQIYVSPESYNYKEVNIMDYLSSGIMFTYKNNLMYNFRIMVDKLFVPIRGIFLDETSFNNKLVSAIKDPNTYINARDPEYILEKLEKMSVDMERLRAATLASRNGNRLVEKEVINEITDIKSKNPSFTYKEIFDQINKEKKVKTSPGIVKDVLNIYYNEY